mmetsp:Transcript_14705/g.25985  ORF Transcript_14705/g.25985 Transcript_14705/m.25985 type:complete len:205 (-) Transcript_14705:333-947(-)
MMVTAEKLYAAANARAEKMVETKKAMHADGMERYAAAKELYLTKVEEILEVLKSQGIKGTAHDAAELVATKVAELRQVPAAVSKDVKNRLHDKFVQLQAAWDKLSSHPEVAKVVNLYSASISTLQAKVAEAHDTLVTNPRYGAALDQAGHYLNMVQGTTVYSRLHAAFAPYAGPYAERLYTSSYMTAAMDYMKPAPALEGIKTK